MMSQLHSGPSPGLRGLLTRDLPNGQTHWYNNTDLRTPLILLDGSFSIRLRNLTCADGGRYSCHLSAPVGEQNREGEVLLRLTGERLTHLRPLHLLPYLSADAGLFFRLSGGSSGHV